MTLQKIDALFERAKTFYDHGDPSHDIQHIRRVIANCKKIGASVGANLEILLPAAILHDVVNLPKNAPNRMEASKLASAKAQQILVDLGYSPDDVLKIQNVITEHSFSLGKKPSSIESAVLQDADKLDALGAIGIMRTVSTGVRMKASYYQPEDPFAKDRELDDLKFTVDHFYRKLLKLADMMNTDAAKEEARHRTQFMHIFLTQLQNEIG